MFIIVAVVCWAVASWLLSVVVQSFACLMCLQSHTIQQDIQTQAVDQLENYFASLLKVIILLPNYLKNIVSWSILSWNCSSLQCLRLCGFDKQYKIFSLSLELNSDLPASIQWNNQRHLSRPSLFQRVSAFPLVATAYKISRPPVSDKLYLLYKIISQNYCSPSLIIFLFIFQTHINTVVLNTMLYTSKCEKLLRPGSSFLFTLRSFINHKLRWYYNHITGKLIGEI